MAQSEFDPSIATIIPLMPGLSDETIHRTLREFYKWGEPWKHQYKNPISPYRADKTPKERMIILRNAAEAGNLKAMKEMAYRLALSLPEEDRTDAMKKTIKDFEKPEKHKRYLQQHRFNNYMKETEKKFNTKPIDITYDKHGNKIVLGGNSRIAVPLNHHKDASAWNRFKNYFKGYGSKFIKSPLGKVAIGSAKLSGAALTPLWLAGELEADAEFGFDKKNLGLDTWFAKTRWNEETQQLEKY